MSFPQFAFNNVRRNARAYTGFFLSSAFMVMIFFSYSVFIYHPDVTSFELGTISAAGMKIASYIVFIFAFFFVLYSIGAFLKMRNHEFGILTMLGAHPGQINKLILLENMMIGLLSIVSGIAGGMLLSKLFLLLSTKAMDMEPLLFYWPLKALVITTVSFIALFLVISIFTLLFIRKNQVLELLKGSIQPKKAPKVSLLLSSLGLAMLIIGAVTLHQDLSEKKLAIAAVTGVIGTYLFYSQLSVLAIRLIKRNRKRLWRGTHLLSVSEMSYKLKDNARMLFLVTVVTALACMASGFLLSISHANKTAFIHSPFAIIHSGHDKENAEPGLEKIRSTLSSAGVQYEENRYEFIQSSIKTLSAEQFDTAQLMSLSRFNQLAGIIHLDEIPLLSDDEAVLMLNSHKTFGKYSAGEEIQLANNVDKQMKLYEVIDPPAMPFGQYSQSIVIVSDPVYTRAYDVRKSKDLIVNYTYKIPEWDGPLPTPGESQIMISTELVKWSRDQNRAINNWSNAIEARANTYAESKQATSTMSFIGIFIALIFSLSSASFLYFKLHTELTADVRMYHALSKIGLTTKEMSVSATRQIALLFYIPVAVASLQTLVVIRPVMSVFNYTNTTVPLLIASAAFFSVQTLYFLMIRSRYIHSLKKMMV